MTSRANDLANLMSSTTVGTRDLTLDSDFSANTIASSTSVSDVDGDVRKPVLEVGNAVVSVSAVGSGILHLDNAATTTLVLWNGNLAAGDIHTIYNDTGAAVTITLTGFTNTREDGSGTSISGSTVTLADKSLLTATVISSTVLVLSSANLTVV